MSVRIEGVDDLADQLDSLAAELDGDVHFSELFTAQFMRTHTDEFGSFEEFLEESPWTVESEVDFEAIPEREFDEYVAGNTVFKDWESMMSAAAREWAVRQLDS